MIANATRRMWSNRLRQLRYVSITSPIARVASLKSSLYWKTTSLKRSLYWKIQELLKKVPAWVFYWPIVAALCSYLWWYATKDAELLYTWQMFIEIGKFIALVIIAFLGLGKINDEYWGFSDNVSNTCFITAVLLIIAGAVTMIETHRGWGREPASLKTYQELIQSDPTCATYEELLLRSQRSKQILKTDDLKYAREDCRYQRTHALALRKQAELIEKQKELKK